MRTSARLGAAARSQEQAFRSCSDQHGPRAGSHRGLPAGRPCMNPSLGTTVTTVGPLPFCCLEAKGEISSRYQRSHTCPIEHAKDENAVRFILVFSRPSSTVSTLQYPASTPESRDRRPLDQRTSSTFHDAWPLRLSSPKTLHPRCVEISAKDAGMSVSAVRVPRAAEPRLRL